MIFCCFEMIDIDCMSSIFQWGYTWFKLIRGCMAYYDVKMFYCQDTFDLIFQMGLFVVSLQKNWNDIMM
jgi:hypothetical protein